MKTVKKALLFSLIALLCLSACPFPAAAENAAPIAENLEIKTYRNTSVGGQLKAVDPDGDTVSFVLTTPPVKGTVELQSDGNFVYTPKEGKKGRDYFGFKATDSTGNSSQEGTVIIKIEKQKSKVCYADLHGHSSEYAAVLAAELGVYTGERLGKEYVFSPNAAVSRGEFLAMCMQLSGDELLSSVMSTGFADDTATPDWMKPYISTALMNDDIQGYSLHDGAVFDANAPIRCYEAAVMLNNILGTDNVVTTSALDIAAAPSWAAQAVSSLSACGVITSKQIASNEVLTRAQAVSLLSSAYENLH